MSGGAITNCKASDDSGAVDIGNGCTFIMNSGTISGCRADDDAGAIFIKGNASFVMNGGTIENCSAGFCGGAVKIRNTSSFTMTGGTISNCTAQQGGGVYVDDSSTFNMNGGSIANCTAVNGGNSVFVMSGTGGKFTMTDGTVDGSVTLHFTVAGSDVYMDGLGTAAYPYQISTADQLKLFRDIVNGTGDQAQNRGAYAVLTANIDLNNEPWTPIGPDRDSAYTGTFDGQGHTVKNLSVTVNVQPGRAGLFGCVKDGTIRKLTVAGSVSCTANQGWCGGIAGYAMDETIENCASLCTVSCTGIDARVGGIVGLVDYNSRTLIIRDCYNIGKITGRSDNGSGDAGGICGFYMNGKISNCYNVGEITGSGYVSKLAVSAYNDIRPTNCYYLSDTDTDLNGTAKTAAEFANGDVLEELKAGQRDNNADPWADECKYLDAAGKTLPVFNGQGDAHDHQSNDWKSNETEHWQVCTCGVVFHKAQHSGGTATCIDKAVCEFCKAEYGEKLPHDFTAETVDAKYLKSAATCTEKAVYYKSCAVCGLSSEGTADEATFFSGNALDHDWGAWTQNSDEKTHTRICKRDTSHTETENCHGGTATCKAQAICEICGDSYGSLDPNNHTDLKHIDAKAATAAEEGNIAYWYCDGCKKYFSDAAATKEITKAATVTAKLPPKITAGDGAAVTQGEKKELTFTSDASFADFVRVELDGTALEEKNYTKREGSTIITLNRDFVAALSVGEHTLAIVSQHGTATAKFTVKAKPTETATPQPTVTPQPTAQPTPTVQPVSPIPGTGDTANPALWFALLIVSGGAAIGITVASRKKKHNK